MLWMDMWVHPFTDTPLIEGVDFLETWIWLSPSDVVKSWLRLQSPLDCIPHPYCICLMCFSTLICCGWAHGCTLTLFCLFMWEWIFGKLRACWSPSDVVMSWLRLHSLANSIPHPCQIYTKCFVTLICCGWAHGCTLTLFHLCRCGWSLEN